MRKIASRISRRTLLKGTGAALALPWLDIMKMPTDQADPMARLKRGSQNNRLAYLYFPNGSAKGSWQPEKISPDGSLQKLNRWMAPLESVKQHLLVTNNLWTPRGNGHGAGTATWLTDGGYNERKIQVGGRSADQIVAHRLKNQTVLPSLELSVKGEGHFSGCLPRNSISWRDAGTPLERETEPRSVFDRMFRTSADSAIDRSVVDIVLEHARQIKRAGSIEDQRKIDEYLESVRGLEKRLDFAEQQTQQALDNRQVTDTLTRPQPGIPSNHQAYVRLMLDLIVLAFWADATRVCTFMLDHGQSNRYFDFIPDCKGTWHALSHYRDISGRTEDDDGKTSWNTVSSKRDMYNRVTRWHHAQFAYLIKKLHGIREANGQTLLESSTLCYGSSISDGHNHGEDNLPLILAGYGGGSINPGRFLNPPRATSMSRMHLAMMQTMGIDFERLGDEERPLDLL